MGYEFAIEADIIRCTLSGVVTREELSRIVATVEDLERGRDPVPHRLTDLTGVTDLQIGYPDMRALAERRRASVFATASKSALVVRTPAQRGMARMFQTLNDNPQLTVEIFDDAASALRWLRS